MSIMEWSMGFTYTDGGARRDASDEGVPGGRPRTRLIAPPLHFDRIDSTNTYLKRRAAEVRDGTVVTADHQTAGRGRMGRSWTAPPSSSLMMSALLIEPADSPLLTWGATLACVAACEAIESICGHSPRLRWPNDLILSGGKVGGVLAESTPLPGARRAVVIGVGVNCRQQAADFDETLRGIATSLALEGAAAAAPAVLRDALIERLDAWLAATRDGRDVVELRRQWRSRLADVGRPGAFLHDGSRIDGTIAGVSDEGDLLIDLSNGERRRLGAATTTRIR